MQERRRSVLRDQIEAIARSDFEAFAERLTPDAILEIHAPDAFSFVRHAEGREAIRAAVERNFGMLAGQQPGPISLVSEGSEVVVIARETGCMIRTGETYDCHFVVHYRFKDDRISHIREVVAFTVPESL
jgi:ketosteroid isomerase-like protein